MFTCKGIVESIDPGRDYKISELAAMGINKGYLYRMVKGDKIGYCKFFGKTYINGKEMLRYLNHNTHII